MPAIPVTWRDQQVVNTVTTGGQFDPDIIQLANGNILVCWTSNDNTVGTPGAQPGLDVIGQIFDPLGNRIGGEIRLNEQVLDDEEDMDMAALPGGGFVVVYEDDDGTAPDLRLQEYDANGVQVSSSVTIVADPAAADPAYRNPRVAVSSATSVMIVYE